MSDIAANAESSAAASDAQPPEQSERSSAPIHASVIRTRVIPGLVLAMVVGLLGLLAYSLFAPDEGRFANDCRVQALGYCVYDDPETARTFTLETFDGQTVDLSDYRGKIVVLNFWASWCVPCRDETPLLETAYSTLGDDVVLLGINIQDDDASAQDFLDEYGVTYASSKNGDSVSIDYGVTSVPETYVIDATGKRVVKLIGQVRSVDQLQAMVAVAR